MIISLEIPITMILVDTNILIYSLNRASPKFKKAQTYILAKEDSICIAQQNVIELYRVITHPTFKLKVSLDQIRASINGLISGIPMLTSSLQTYAIWERLITEIKVKGNNAFDAYLVATMLTNGVTTIATDNSKHFENFPHITVINPFV